MKRKIISASIVFLLLTVLSPLPAMAASLLQWDAVSGEVTGYRIYYGTALGNYPQNVEVGNVTQYSLDNLSLTQGATYYFVVRAYNTAGESSNSNAVTYLVPDTTPPMPPAGVSVQNGSSRVTWQANSENDLDGYRLYYGTTSGSYSPFIPAGAVTSYTVPNLVAGTTYYFAVTAVDTSGNESSYSTEVSSTISDAEAPVVAITTPTTGATYAATEATLNMAGTASDNVGVGSVRWENAAGGSGVATGTANWSVANIALAEGANMITVIAADAAGNETSKTLTVTYTPPVVVDTQSPTISVTAPTTGSNYTATGATVNLAGTASDNVGVAQVTWTNSSGGAGVATGTTNWTISNVSLNAGDNIITVKALDAAGNEGGRILTVVYSPPDTAAPVISFISPTSGSTFTATSSVLDMTGTASDNVGVTSVTWATSNGASGTATGTTNWSAANILLREGDNIITVSAEDAAGNKSQRNMTVTYTIPDTAPPAVVVTAPSVNGAYTAATNTVNLAGTASDNKAVAQVRWRNDRGGGDIASGTTSWSVSGVSLAQGDNTITMTATDTAGNEGTTNIVVTYNPPDTINPTVSIQSPTSSGTYTTAQSTVAMAGTAADTSGIRQVQWRNSRGGSGTASGTTSWSVSGIQLAGGQNVITITAVDAAGNSGTRNLTVTYNPPDTTDPSIRISSPASSTGVYETKSADVSLAGSASDNVGVTEVKWANSNGSEGTASGTSSWTIADVSLSNGDNVITVTAVDAAGNEKTASITVRYTAPDTTPPSIAISSPTKGKYYFTRRSTLDISGTAGDASGIKAVAWQNSTGGSGTASGTTRWSSSGISLKGGWNIITVTATDSAGNEQSDSLYVICWSF